MLYSKHDCENIFIVMNSKNAVYKEVLNTQTTIDAVQTQFNLARTPFVGLSNAVSMLLCSIKFDSGRYLTKSILLKSKHIKAILLLMKCC